jgi:hypothetical protein
MRNSGHFSRILQAPVALSRLLIRASGVTVPLSDLLIFACAKVHGLGIAHRRRPF